MISVVMPAHNEQDYLEAAVGMVLERLRGGEPPFEVLVAENGSTDGTAAVAQRLAAANPEVLLLQAPAADYGQALRAGFMATLTPSMSASSTGRWLPSARRRWC